MEIEKKQFATQVLAATSESIKNLAKAEGMSQGEFIDHLVFQYAQAPDPNVVDIPESDRFYFNKPKTHYEACAAIEELLEQTPGCGSGSDWGRKALTMVIARSYSPTKNDPQILKWRTARAAQGPLDIKSKQSGENNSRRG